MHPWRNSIVGGVFLALFLSVAITFPAKKVYCSLRTCAPLFEEPVSESIVIDVRSEEEFAAGHIKGAHLVPQEQALVRIPALVPERNAQILLYCRSGRRAGMVKSALEALGYQNVQNLGSMSDATTFLHAGKTP